MKPDIKKSTNDLFAAIEQIIGAKGFQVNRSEATAFKKTAAGFCEMYFDINKVHDYTYTIGINFNIRCDSIQEVRGKINPRYADPGSATIAIMLHTLLKALKNSELDTLEDDTWVVNFEHKSSIDKWLDWFKRFMEEIGFSFFDRFKSVEDFDIWFNKPVLENDFEYEKSLNLNNSVYGLIAARLIQSKEYEKIYNIRLNDLAAKKKEQAVQELQKTKEFLDTHL